MVASQCNDEETRLKAQGQTFPRSSEITTIADRGFPAVAIVNDTLAALCQCLS